MPLCKQGMDDRVVPPSMTDFVHRLLPGAAVHKLPYQGHYTYFCFCDECHRQIFTTLFGAPQGPLPLSNKIQESKTCIEGSSMEDNQTCIEGSSVKETQIFVEGSSIEKTNIHVERDNRVEFQTPFQCLSEEQKEEVLKDNSTESSEIISSD